MPLTQVGSWFSLFEKSSCMVQGLINEKFFAYMALTKCVVWFYTLSQGTVLVFKRKHSLMSSFLIWMTNRILALCSLATGVGMRLDQFRCECACTRLEKTSRRIENLKNDCGNNAKPLLLTFGLSIRFYHFVYSVWNWKMLGFWNMDCTKTLWNRVYSTTHTNTSSCSNPMAYEQTNLEGT